MNTITNLAQAPVVDEEEPMKADSSDDPVSSQATPQAFYDEIAKRPAVREILEELATL